MSQDADQSQGEISTASADYPGWQEWWLTHRFKERFPYDIPTPGHLQSMAAIVEGLGSPWNIPTNWDKCKWYHTAKGAISFTYGRDLATYDRDRLTSLVLAAHKHSVRIEIEPCNPRYLRLIFWPRVPDGDSFASKHPTLEDLARRAEKEKSECSAPRW